ECPINEIDVDEEVKTNEQCAKILSDLTDWNWIFGKTPKFWFENGHTKHTRHARAVAVRPLSVVETPFRRNVVTQKRFYAAAERHEFQAETKNLMDIVAKSLYSNSE
ncbi:hypothetical protein OSTOST_19151, partial [Ostertagia ostertagi]